MTYSDLDEALAEVEGIETPKKKKNSRLKPIQCPKCGTINPAGHKYCETCCKPLTEEAAGELATLSKMLYEKLKKDPLALLEMMK